MKLTREYCPERYPVFTENHWLHRCQPLASNGWSHGWSDISGPDFKSPVQGLDHQGAMKELCRKVGLESAAWAEQVHGGTVLKVESPGFAGQADALWTDRPQLGVVGRSADCPLILMGGTMKDGARMAGFAHASWRSTVRGITASLAAALREAGARLESMQAVICPSAGPCCYEVGPEVREEACSRLGDTAARHFHDRGDRFILDLWSANSEQLVQAGVNPERIYRTGHCTICGNPEGDLRFPSYRRQGQLAGRFAAIIGFTG